MLLPRLRAKYPDIFKNTTILDVQNVADYYYEHYTTNYLDTYKDIPNIAPSWPSMWCEWSSTEDSSIATGGVLLKYFLAPEWLPYSIKWLVVGWCFNQFYLEPVWQEWMVVSSEGKLLPITPNCEYYPILCEFLKLPEEDYTKSSLIRDQPIHIAKPVSTELDMDIFNGAFDIPFLALSLAHCKNVKVVEKSKRKPRLNSKQKTKVLYKYYTLLIEPMKKVLREEGNSSSTGLPKALHICRGHFKDYREGKGLFGKIHGLYWWDQMVKGDIGQGKIIKTYKV